MQLDKKNRTELKSYFVKNAIPTEKDFADLIDVMLNQQEDGMAKPPGDPVSIEASGDDASPNDAIYFYRNFTDTNPNWVLSLNPHSDPKDPASGTPGFSISDGEGKSRLFIDRETGNVGIGTTGPRGFQVALPESSKGVNPGAGVTIAGGPSGNASIELRNSGSGTPYIDFAQDGARADYDARIRLTEPGKLAIEGANVGIGTPAPDYRLTVSHTGNHLQLRREEEAAGGKAVFLELYQNDAKKAKVPEVFPCIRFHHAYRFWHRLEARADGLHFKGGDLKKDSYAKVFSGSLRVTGDLSLTGQLNLTGASSILTQENWHAVTFMDGWQNYSSQYNPAGYFKDSVGMVHLRGLVKGGAVGNKTIFVLPVGYRPQKRELHVVCTNPNVSGRADITTDGRVVPLAGNAGWLSLDGITFRAA